MNCHQSLQYSQSILLRRVESSVQHVAECYREHDTNNNFNKNQLTPTDPRDDLRHAQSVIHRAVHKAGS